MQSAIEIFLFNFDIIVIYCLIKTTPLIHYIYQCNLTYIFVSCNILTTGVVIASVTIPRPNLSPTQTKANIIRWLTSKINNKQYACEEDLTKMPKSFHKGKRAL